MAIVVDQVIDQPDKDYPENYGEIIVVVRDTETGRTATASVSYSAYTKPNGEATAEAIKDASDKL